MSYLRAFGSYLPSRIVENAELGAMVDVEPAWILQATGIAERRFAAPEETVASMGAAAARQCFSNAGLAGIEAKDVGLIIASSGSADRRFPGPAATIGRAIGVPGIPAIDLPMASAGSLFGMALAAQLAPQYGNVLVVASEIMSRAVRLDLAGRDTAILFGDGAGACLISPETGFARIAGSLLRSDAEFSDALHLDLDAPLHMDGRTIILQASRKLPRVILDLLEREARKPADIASFVMHQANANLIVRVAQSVGVPEDRFFRNLQKYGNTSSASMLIAAAEWPRALPAIFATFGAGLHWGALFIE